MFRILYKRYIKLRCVASLLIGIFFLLSTILPAQSVYAQNPINLPVPGAMVGLSQPFQPALLTGITIYPDDPLKVEFLIDAGDSQFNNGDLKNEASKLIRYFLTSLTVPEKDIWVNLSPYEEDRIMPEHFAITEMGQGLLEQDYLLKQLTSTLMYPEEVLGQKFWSNIYSKIEKTHGTSEIPLNTFNKVWIVPERANVYVEGANAYVTDSYLKVMLEEDYAALSNSVLKVSDESLSDEMQIAADVVREVILPEIEREVNEGKTFAKLRQIYNAIILATWYKQNIKESLLSNNYVGLNKIEGINFGDGQARETVYKQYLEAFKVGVYDYIKEDYDPQTSSIIPRRYFSGGIVPDAASAYKQTSVGSSPISEQGRFKLGIRLRSISQGSVDPAMQSDSEEDALAEFMKGLGSEMHQGVQAGLGKAPNSEVPRIRRLVDSARERLTGGESPGREIQVKKELVSLSRFVEDTNSQLRDFYVSTHPGIGGNHTNYYKLQLVRLENGDNRIGNVFWKSSGLREIDEFSSEEQHVAVLPVSDELTPEDILNMIYFTFKDVYLVVPNSYPGVGALRGENNFANHYYVQHLIDRLIIPFNINTPQIMDELLSYTQNRNLPIRLEAVCGLEKLGVLRDKKVGTRLTQMAAEEYDDYKESQGITEDMQRYADFHSGMFRVVKTYATDVVDVISQVEAEQTPDFQWRWRPVGSDQNQKGRHLIDKNGKLLAFAGQLGYYSLGHLIVFDNEAYERAGLYTGEISNVYGAAVGGYFGDAESERIQQQALQERKAEENLPFIFNWFNAGYYPEHIDDEAKNKLMQIFESTGIGKSNLSSILRFYIRNLKHSDTKIQDVINALMVRLVSVHKVDVMKELFMILLDSNETIEDRINLGWWLTDGYSFDPSETEQIIEKLSVDVSDSDRQFFLSVVMLNWWKHREINRTSRGQGLVQIYGDDTNKLLLAIIEQLRGLQSRVIDMDSEVGTSLISASEQEFSADDIGNAFEARFGRQLQGWNFSFETFAENMQEVLASQERDPFIDQLRDTYREIETMPTVSSGENQRVDLDVGTQRTFILRNGKTTVKLLVRRTSEFKTDVELEGQDGQTFYPGQRGDVNYGEYAFRLSLDVISWDSGFSIKNLSQRDLNVYEVKDAAMISSPLPKVERADQNLGGIDLNPANIPLIVDGDKIKFSAPLNSSYSLGIIPIQGFTFDILYSVPAAFSNSAM